MAAQTIPLDNSPQQSLAVALTVDGKTLRLQLAFSFSEMAQYWLMDIYDGLGNLLLSSIPCVTGDWPAANLLAQYGYLRIGSCYIINLGQVNNDYPGPNQLGAPDFALLWDDTVLP